MKLGIALVIGLSASVAACAGWGKTACLVIDTLEASCAVVRYVGVDGGVVETTVPTSELAAAGAARAGMAAASTDGGCK